MKKFWPLYLFFFLNLFFLCWRNNQFLPLFLPSSQPQLKKEVSLKNLSAQGAVVVDRFSGTVIWQHQADKLWSPASITKLATALVAKKLYSPQQQFLVKKEYAVGKVMGLEEGEIIDRQALLKGLLIHSANDAAFVLAGQEQPLIKDFVRRMNKLVDQLNLYRTNFVNFDGEDDEGHYSSAWDIAQLGRYFVQFSDLAKITQEKEAIVYSSDRQVAHHLETTNKLLSSGLPVYGLKTGWTPKSGQSLASWVVLSPGRELLVVVLGSKDRFSESFLLIKNILPNLEWRDYSNHSLAIAGI